MTPRQYKLIKLLYNGVLCVELPYSEDYKVGDIYRLGEFKAIIKKVKLSPNYFDDKQTCITLELI